jgi:hypothetical protein
MFIESFFYTTPILSSEQISELFPQRHPIHSDIKIIYHYGERYYSASAVDALLPQTQQQQTQQKQTQQTQQKQTQQTQQKQTHESAATSETETEAIKTTTADSPRSVISESESVRQRGGSAAAPGSRSIGKRNQQFYLPDGCVKLMHISVGLENDIGGITDVQNDDGDKWYGRYEKDKNTIVRTSTEYELAESVDICEYETLAHFAQEHDKECWGDNYTPSNTHNVWKNSHYLFFNTVTLKWEPLSKLR